MKKITKKLMLMLVLVLTWQAHAQCDYTLEMNDAYGDGWTFNTLDVLVNNVVVLKDMTLEDGSQGLVTFSVNTGDDITTIWNGFGEYGEETSYRILDSNGVEVGAGSESDIATGTITGACSSCDAAEATVTVVPNCAADTYTLNIQFSTLGDATSVSDGTTSYTITGATAVAGPYAIGTKQTMSVIHSDTECNFELGDYGINACPPANDECSTAIALTVNNDLECSTVTAGTVFGATDSGVTDSGCTSGSSNDDVWYSFVATSTSHTVSLTNISGSTLDLYHSVFDATPGCGSLGAAIECSNSNTSNLTNLTIGNTYYLQVYTSAATAGQNTTFDICIGTEPTCYIPDDIETVFTAPDKATITWSAPTKGNTPISYKWEVVPQGNAKGTGVVASGTSTETTATVTGLSIDALYDVYVQTDCGTDDLSNFTKAYVFRAGHCLPSGSNTNTYIDNFTATGLYANISNLDSGLSVNNYGDFYASQTVEVESGTSFDFELEIVSGSVGSAILIDWNNDYVFDQATETVFNTTGALNGPFTGTITVPNGTPIGTYRMRAIVDYGTNNPSSNACALSSGRGEIEDYKVTVRATLSNTDNLNINKFTYYPNTVSNILNIQAQKDVSNVSIYNMLGQEVLRKAPKASVSAIDVSKLKKGAYLVKVTIEEVTETVRIIKN